MNIINLTGNVGNAELKKVGSNDLLTFSLAVKKNFAKEGMDNTQWFKCNLWGKRATALQQYIVKGAGLAISGEMDLNYNPSEKKSFPQVNVNNVDIMKWANDSQQNNQQKQSYQQNSSTYQQPHQQSNDDFGGFQAIDGEDDSIPF